MFQKIKEMFKKKPNYKELYENELGVSEHWEFKYNTLAKSIKEIADKL